MKLTSMFESSSETSAVMCPKDGEKSDQCGALLVPASADSSDLPSSKSRTKDDRSSPVLELSNGDVEAELKKTFEPLSLKNGDGASSDDLERISCRTPVGDNDSSSEKENYLFDDGGSEASLKLRVTESEDEGEMSPRAISSFEDEDQDCNEQTLLPTEDHDGSNGESKHTEQNCDNEQQEKETTEVEASSPIVKDQDSETLQGKLLGSNEEGAPDTTCVQEDCHNAQAESHSSDGCHSAELIEPEKSDLCCDNVSDSDTVKCSCDGVCSSTCTCSVLKQEIGSKLSPHTESNISLKLDKCTAEHSVTNNEEQSVSLSTSTSHISVKECSSNNETGLLEDCSSNTIFPVSEPTVSDSEVTTDVAHDSSTYTENITEESVTDSKTTGVIENEPSSVEKLVSSVSGENASSVTGILDIKANTVSDSFSGGSNNGENGDLISKDQSCKSGVVDPVCKTDILEVLPVESGEVSGLSTAGEDINSRESMSSVTNNDDKLESDVNVGAFCMENEIEETSNVKDSGTTLPLAESKLVASQNSATVTNSAIVPDSSAFSCTDVSQENSELIQSELQSVSTKVLEDKQKSVTTNVLEDKQESSTTDIRKDTQESSTNVREDKQESPNTSAREDKQESPTTNVREDKQESPTTNVRDDKQESPTTNVREDKQESPITNIGEDKQGSSTTNIGEDKQDSSTTNIGEDKQDSSTTNIGDDKQDSPTTNIQEDESPSTNIQEDESPTTNTQEDKQESSAINVREDKQESSTTSVVEDKQADVEIPSTVSQNSINKHVATHVNGKGVVCNGTLDDRTRVAIKGKTLLTRENCSSECDKIAANDNTPMINQTNNQSTGESELELKGSKLSVDVNVKGSETKAVTGDRLKVDVNVKGSETKAVTGDRLKVDDGYVEKEKDVDSNIELAGITSKVLEQQKKTTDEMKDCAASKTPKAEVKSHVQLPETGVECSNTEKTKDVKVDRNITVKTLGDTSAMLGDSCEIEEPLTLSDVANALKDAVDTVTLQDGESVPFTGCEASVPPISSEVPNLAPPHMQISDSTSAVAVHVADQEVQPEVVQEAPGIAEAVRRRRKRSVEDVMPDRISKRTRGSSLASSSGANSPEKLTQTNAESTKRPVVDSSAEEDPKRVRLSEDYSKVVKQIERTVANGIATGEIGSRRIFLEKIRAKDLKGLTVAELEEFFVEKICEALAYRHEVGILRQKQQAVENQMEIWRKKTLTMCKQVRDMELVMKRYQNDLKARKDRPVIPVKVTRSVGLQVHDASSDASSRALFHKRKRMEQQASSANAVQRPSPQSPLASNISTTPTSQSASISTRGTTSSPQYSRTATSTNNQTNVPPAAGTRVPAKPNNGLKTLMPRQQSVSVNTNTSTASPNTANSSRAQQMTRSKAASTAGNSPVGTVNKSSRQVIDLTDDGDRGRSAQPRTTAVMTSANTNTVPANNSVGASTTLTPTSSIRILPQPVTATAVAAGTNILATGVTTNSSVPRLTYLVPTSNQLQPRPVLLASSPSQGVPNAVVAVTSGQKNQVYVKNGALVSVSPVTGSGTVGQQVPTSARPAGLQPSVAQGSPSRPQIRPAQVVPGSPQSRALPQHTQHPAPLPVAPNLNLNNPELKKMPPRPELKISKQSRHQGIVLSWNMPVTNEYASIASYQLYAYQESSSPPSTAHWKKVGDVKALPLPMACTLTQFVEGHKYHFAVRAVDIHSRVGPFSLPGSIVLTRK